MKVYYRKYNKKVDYIERKYRGYVKNDDQDEIEIATDNILADKLEKGYPMTMDVPGKKIDIDTENIPEFYKLIDEADAALANATSKSKQQDAFIAVELLKQGITPIKI